MKNLILPPPELSDINFDPSLVKRLLRSGFMRLISSLVFTVLTTALCLPLPLRAQSTCGGWSEAVIGTPLSGSTNFTACNPGTITITSAGFPTSYTADKQYMVQRELCGNGEIVVNIQSISGGLAGLEIRADNTPGSICASLKTAGSNFLFRSFRTAPGASASPQPMFAFSHSRLKLVRNGNNVVAWYSSFGDNWIQAGVFNLPLPNCVQMGVLVESDNNAPATGVFNNLSFSGFSVPNSPVTTFSFAAESLNADAGEEVQVCVNITNPCACAPASVQAALQGNAAPHLSGFSTQTLQFQSGDTQKCFSLSTAAAPGDGSYTLILQNPSGGNAAAIGAQPALAVAVTGEPETPTDCPWAGPDREICRGESVVIGCPDEVQPPAGSFYCYKWAPEEGLDDPSLPQPTASPQQTTTYTLYVTDNQGNVVATDGVLVTVKGSEITISADREVLCPGETALLSTEEGMTSYSWSLDGAPITETTHAVIANLPGKYEVEVIDLDGCEVSAEIIIASPDAQSGLKDKFISDGFICIPITIIEDDPGILPPSTNAKSLLTLDLVDDFANKNILIEGASEYPVNVSEIIENFLEENFLSDYSSDQLKGYVTENSSFCGDAPDAVTYEQIRTDFQAKEIGFWFHLWKNPDIEGEDCLLVKAKTPRVAAPGFSPVSEEHSAYIFEIIDLIKLDNPLPGDFSSQGERIVYALCVMLWEGFEIEIAENPDDLLDVLELKIKEQAPPGTMGISQFINLVKAEEAKYPESEQRNTKLMITRLRRIFYNGSGFNNYLIPNAPSVNVVPSPYGDHLETERGRLTVMGKRGMWPSFDIVDTENYPFDPQINGKPAIYNNQEVRLEAGVHAGLHIDMGHVFCALDAFNYQSTVHFPILIGRVVFLPDNLSASTWIGDLGSSLAYARAAVVNNQFLPSDLQAAIDIGTPAKDMLGNIDGYVIANSYLAPLTITAPGSAGTKVSEILENYYLGVSNYYTFNGLNLFQNKRYSIFAARIGLQWQPATQAFLNEPAKVIEYGNQVGTSGLLFVGVNAPGIHKIAATIFGTELKFIPFRKELARLLFKSLKQAIIDQE